MTTINSIKVKPALLIIFVSLRQIENENLASPIQYVFHYTQACNAFIRMPILLQNFSRILSLARLGCVLMRAWGNRGFSPALSAQKSTRVFSCRCTDRTHASKPLVDKT